MDVKRGYLYDDSGGNGKCRRLKRNVTESLP